MPTARRDDVAIEHLLLDPRNPRLPERETERTQDELIRTMARDYSLLELAQSFVDNGYFEEEPLVAIPAHGQIDYYLVVEGNRRLATLKLLADPTRLATLELPPIWREHATQWQQRGSATVPVLIYPSRSDVIPYLGFRHISGVKQWDPPEKARFINELVESGACRFSKIAREVGSNAQSVRDSYVAYRVLVQAREMELDTAGLEKSFGVLLRTMSSADIKKFLGIETAGREPPELRRPVPDNRADQLRELLVWLFGSADQPRVIQDSRDITKLGRVLTNEQTLDTLRVTSDFRLAVDELKGEGASVLESLKKASYELDEVKRGVDRHAANPQIREWADRCRRSVDTIAKMLV